MNSLEAIDKIFDEYDTEKRGTLNRNNLTTLFYAFSQVKGNLRVVTPEDIEKALQYIGKDSNGILSKTEFLQFIERLVSQR